MGPFYEEYGYTTISTVLKDTVTGRETIIRTRDFGSTIETTRIYTVNRDSLRGLKADSRLAYTRTALDTIFGPLSIYGYLTSLESADTDLYYRNVLRIDSRTEYHETIRFDNQSKAVRNTTAYVKNGLVLRNVESTWLDGHWNVNVKEGFEYYPCGNVRMKIRDDFRKGEFAYRFVTFFKYEYF